MYQNKARLSNKKKVKTQKHPDLPNQLQARQIAGGSKSQLSARRDRRRIEVSVQDQAGPPAGSSLSPGLGGTAGAIEVSAQCLAGSPADCNLSSVPGGIEDQDDRPPARQRIDRARDRADCSARTVQYPYPKINIF